VLNPLEGAELMFVNDEEDPADGGSVKIARFGLSLSFLGPRMVPSYASSRSIAASDGSSNRAIWPISPEVEGVMGCWLAKDWNGSGSEEFSS
jgi:hypothetical protein